MSGSKEKALPQPNARALMEEFNPIAQRLESERQKTLTKIRGILISVSVTTAAVALITLLFLFRAGAGIAPLIGTGVCGLIGYLVYTHIKGKEQNRFRNLVKTELYKPAVHKTLPGIDYTPQSMVPQDTFRAGNLFSSRIDRYNGEDCFHGQFDATKVMFSELHVERIETSTDSKGKTTQRNVTVFKGIYLIADFHKEFSGRVEILPDVAEATFGWLGRKMQGISKNLVRLENPEFEKAFKVSSSDPQTARYLLTPDMQERFLQLRSDWSPDIRAALQNSHLHLAIPQKENWFEPNLHTPVTDIASLHTFLIRLNHLLAITQTLDLNTRLWTKE